MRVLVAGGHGTTGQHLVRLLPSAGHVAAAMVRDPAQGPVLEALGAEVVVADLEADPSHAVHDVDAVVFAAGAGPGSGAARKETVDYEGAVKLADAAQAAGVRRFVVLSAKGADRPADYDGVMAVYMDAKSRADAHVRASGLDWTIVRPGPLADDPPTGRIAAATTLDGRDGLPREDLAAVLVAVLDRPALIRRQFDLLGGDTPIAAALDALSNPNNAES